MKCDKVFSVKRTMIGILAVAVIAAMLMSLISCARESKPAYTPVVSVSHTAQFYIDALNDAGVHVIHLGETYRIVIPSERLFNANSANLFGDSRGLLHSLAGLLNTYHIVSVRVAAYSDRRHAGSHKDALVQRQASVVQANLSDHGIKARLIYADGQGSQHSVAWNGTAAGRYANRRVEVSFHYIPKTTTYG
jgi:outer membrane protein OmpA-like peptidoglycan-associated protein